MKEITIVHVGVGSVAKIVGLANAIVAVVAGVIGALASTASIIANNHMSVLENIVIAIGVVAGYVILLPILAFVFGWLYGAVVALVWNFLLGAANGVDVEFVDKK